MAQPSLPPILNNAWMAVVLLVACGGGGSSAPEAAAPPPPASAPAPAPGGTLTATRVVGPAPLAVQVDATALGAFNGVYDFDFGDPASGTWLVSGLPKNTQRGAALAAHVYDQPGVYTVQVGTASLTVTVQDPAAVFAGNATVCVSTSGNYSGCPAGALNQTSLPSSYAGKRVLLRRGESFGAITPRSTDSAFQVGAFGTGAKPNVTGVLTGAPAAGSVVPSDWTVMDLNVGTGAVSIEVSTTRFLFYRNDVVQYGDSVAMLNIGTAVGYYQANGHPDLPWPREVFLVDNNVLGVVGARGAAPNVTAMGHFYRSAILGNTLDRAHEHTFRIWATSKTVIAHNAMGGSHFPDDPVTGIGIRSALKLHAAGLLPFTDRFADSPRPASSQVVLANNRFGSPTFPGSWLSGLGPQNTDEVEGLEDMVAENNVYTRNATPGRPTFEAELTLRGRRLTHRNNTLSTGGPATVIRVGEGRVPDPFPRALDAWDGPYISQ